jgi:hypothetical protein
MGVEHEDTNRQHTYFAPQIFCYWVYDFQVTEQSVHARFIAYHPCSLLAIYVIILFECYVCWFVQVNLIPVPRRGYFEWVKFDGESTSPRMSFSIIVVRISWTTSAQVRLVIDPFKDHQTHHAYGRGSQRRSPIKLTKFQQVRHWFSHQIYIKFDIIDLLIAWSYAYIYSI